MGLAANWAMPAILLPSSTPFPLKVRTDFNGFLKFRMFEKILPTLRAISRTFFAPKAGAPNLSRTSPGQGDNNGNNDNDAKL